MTTMRLHDEAKATPKRSLPGKRWHFGAGLLCAAVLGGCAADSGQTRSSSGATARPSRNDPMPMKTIDATRVCSAMAEVDDAAIRGERTAKREELEKILKERPPDEAARFAALYAVEEETDRWKAFHKDNTQRRQGAAGPLGECLIYMSWKLPDQAAPHCQRIRHHAPNAGFLELAQAGFHSSKGDTDKALASLDESLAKNGNCAVANLKKARLLEDQGDVDAASDSYNAALSAFPGCFACAAGIARIIEAQQGMDAALPEYERALAIAPQHAETLKRYAKAQVGRNDQKALDAYKNGLKPGDPDHESLFTAAQLANRLADLAAAIDFGERTVAVKADHVDAWRFLALRYRAKVAPGDEGKAWSKVLELSPSDAEAHIGLARLATKGEKWVDAVNHYIDAQVAFEAKPGDTNLMKQSDREYRSLRKRLSIRAEKKKEGARTLVNEVQKTAQVAFWKARKRNRKLKGGITVVVTTNKKSLVTAVEVRDNQLGSEFVAASIVGNFRGHTMWGGEKRRRIEMTFE